MLYNSIPFLIFFSVVYTVYWNLSFRYRHSLLIIAGLIFYGYSSVSFLLHFLIIILVNYYLYSKLHQENKKSILITAVVINVLNLATFKYFYFFMKVIGDITGNPIFYDAHKYIKIILPLAISFYSFQMIAAAVDAYRNPSSTPLPLKSYLLFVLFFPVLIAGPIMRVADFLPNLEKEKPERDQIYRACFLMMSGLIKKILIADPVAGMIAPVYGNPNEYSGFTLFMAGILYTLQVYSDFSGLTDMARSVGLFLGFELPENFFAPFFSLNMRDLWRKWHATFSFWLRDYIYFSLGGSRSGEFRTYLNLMLTMTIGGFWHGANYTFIVWGAYMGAILCFERFFEEKYKLPLTPQKNPVLKIFKAFIVFLLFSISALMFRSNDWKSLVDLFRGLFTNHPNYLRDEIASKNGQWILEGMDLISGEPSFMMNTITSYESVVYMYLMFLFFHYVQHKPETFQKLEKYYFPLVVVFGVITIFLLSTMSQSGGGFIYNKF